MADVESLEVDSIPVVKSPDPTKNQEEESSEDDDASDLKKKNNKDAAAVVENQEEEDPGASLPLREFKVVLPGLKEPICFNPLVSGIGVLFLWGLSIWSMVSFFVV